MSYPMVGSRPYSGPDDLAAMIDLVRARPADRFDDFPGIIDLQEMLGLEEIRANTQLWVAENYGLMGYAILDDTRLICEMAPPAAPDLFPRIVAWASEQLLVVPPVEAKRPALEMRCRENDTFWFNLLEKQGFDQREKVAVHMKRSLLIPLSEPVLPDGFIIRAILGEQEVAAHVALHRAAWGTENMTVEYRLSMMRTPSYDRTLDLVVVAPNGRLAAYAMCYISPEENELSGRQDGYIDPIATHPDFQRRGLAKALMAAGMKLLYTRGMETARLSTGSDNVAMQHAAAGAEFRVDFRTIRFVKLLDV